MLGSIFKWLVLSSVKASIVIAGILLFKLLLGKKLNAKWHLKFNLELVIRRCAGGV